MQKIITRPADYADVMAAGYDFPERDALAPLNHETATRLLAARRDFWISAALGYLRYAEEGSRDALEDALEAFAQADLLAPRGRLA